MLRCSCGAGPKANASWVGSTGLVVFVVVNVEGRQTLACARLFLAVMMQALEQGELFPPFDRILDVSARVAARVAKHLVETGRGVRPAQCPPHAQPERELETWVRHVRANMWRPPPAPPAPGGTSAGDAAAAAEAPREQQQLATSATSSPTTRMFGSRL